MRFQLSRSKIKQDWVILVLQGPSMACPRSLSSLALMIVDHLDGKYFTSLTLRRLVMNSATLIKYLRHQNRRAKANQSLSRVFRPTSGSCSFLPHPAQGTKHHGINKCHLPAHLSPFAFSPGFTKSKVCSSVLGNCTALTVFPLR